MGTVGSELVKMLHLSGRKEEARLLRDEPSLDLILESVRDWMKGKKCLGLLDDVWDRNNLGAAIVHQIAGLFSKGSRRNRWRKCGAQGQS